MIQRLGILLGEAKVSYQKKRRERQIDKQTERALTSLPDNWKEVSNQLTAEGHASPSQDELFCSTVASLEPNIGGTHRRGKGQDGCFLFIASTASSWLYRLLILLSLRERKRTFFPVCFSPFLTPTSQDALT